MSEQPRVGIYLIAALLSNVPLLFLILFLTFIDPIILLENPLFFQILFFATMFGGAAVSSYFLVRRFATRSQVLGLVTGSLSYPIYLVYNLLFYRGYMVLGGYWPLIAFISGGIAGAQLRHMVHGRKPRSSRG